MMKCQIVKARKFQILVTVLAGVLYVLVMKTDTFTNKPMKYDTVTVPALPTSSSTFFSTTPRPMPSTGLFLRSSVSRSYSSQLMSQSTSKSCIRHHHFGFIKVHKAGSSTVANILFRFGVSNKLTFVLPKNGVIISMEQTASWGNILPPPNGRHFDILCSHAVYVKAEIRKLLPEDTLYSAIIREPFSHLQSVIYYFYGNRIPGARKVKRYLKNPYFYSNLLYNNVRSFTNNSMSYELGLAPKHFFNKTYIEEFLKILDSEFGLILIMERMDASLVLLKRYMCLKLQEILYIPRNTNKLKPDSENVTQILRRKHRKINTADYMLYEYFSKKLQDRIDREGPGFASEVNVFQSALKQLRQLCLGLSWPLINQVYIRATRWNQSYNISRENCKLYLFDGIEILDYVKHYQYPDTS